jgi:Ca2+/Na+ antiporter
MSTKQWILTAVIVAPIVTFLAVYIGLISDGSVPPPDLNAIVENLQLGTVNTGNIFIVLAVIVIGVMALIAPIIYAARSHDLITFLISLAMTGCALTLIILSRSVMDQIIALIIYLANITLSAIVYAAHRLSR